MRAALLLVARGEAPLGIVYSTDAAAEPDVRIVGDFPAKTRIRRSSIRRRSTKESKNADAKAFLDFLRSAKARTVVREAGLHGPGEVRLLDMTPEEWTAVRLSLLVATTATLASLPFGIAIAWLLARRQFWGKSLLDTLVHLPLVLPPVVTGYLLLISFGKRGPIGAFLDQASASSSPSAGPARRWPAR